MRGRVSWTSWLGALIVSAISAQPALATTRTVELDGDGDYIRVTADPRLNPTGGITLEAWVRPTTTNGCRTIVGKDYSTGIWFGLCEGRIRFYPNGSVSARDGIQAVRAGDWTQVAVTFDGAMRRYYINGHLDFESLTPGPLAINDADLLIGADGPDEPSIGFEFAGNIAEVRLWDRARDLIDIRRDFVKQIAAPRAGLIAVWQLDGSGAEAFGNHPGTPAGDAIFNGPSAPPALSDPLRIPFIAAPSSDGLCQPGEYGSLRLPIWYDDVDTFDFVAWASVGFSGNYLFVCLDAMPVGQSAANAFAAVYIDSEGDGGSVAQATDYRVMLTEDGATFRSQHGDGSGLFVNGGPSASAHRASLEFTWSAEFTIPRSALAGPVFGLHVAHQSHLFSGDDHGWPVDASWTSPDTWASARLDSTGPGFADTATPRVEIAHTPVRPVAGEALTLRATATDDIDLAGVSIFLDHAASPIRVCDFGAIGDRAATCELSGPLTAGPHTYYATATDHLGKIGVSPLGSVRAIVDGRRPRITMSHSPAMPTPGGEIDLVATADDAAGIRSIHIVGDGTFLADDCTFAPPRTPATCTFRLTVPERLELITFFATAEDAEGSTARAGHTLLLRPSGPDDDRDGLDNELEAHLCTDPGNMDTDGDGLKDGWEVLGLAIPGAGTVDLPGMGANPCHKDVFLQYDYERGARVEPEVLESMAATFARHDVTLHVTENERPRPGTDPISPWGAVDAAYQRDAIGDYYFDPKLNWTHDYAYSRHHVGRSGAWGRYFTFDIYTGGDGRCPDNRPCASDTECGGAICAGVCTCPLNRLDPDACRNEPGCARENARDQALRFVHEIGHSLGLGHGGHVEVPRTPVERGAYLSYTGGWDNSNNKPNYISVMNYMYNGGLVCMLPPQPGDTDPRFVSAIDYSGEHLGNLNENSLDERATSTFASNLRAQSCSLAAPGATPVLLYTCFDHDEPARAGSTDTARRYFMVSNGRETVARLADGGLWQLTNLPAHDPGIDWNCDGVISSSVAGSLNGDGADFTLPGELCDRLDNDADGSTDPGCAWAGGEALLAHEDWAIIPSPPDCLAPYLSHDQCYPQPHAYRTGMGAHPDCRPSDSPNVDCPWVVARSALDQTAAYVPVKHDDVPFAPQLPGTESCNGLNDDGDAEIDEGCRDRDGDGVSDGIDNCPETGNTDQADLDHDYLGDVCQTPGPIAGLEVQSSGRYVVLSWTSGLTDILGYDVYRQDRLDPMPRFLGAGYPSAFFPAIEDEVPAPGRYRYHVRAVNLHGEEGPEAVVELTTDPPGCILDVDWDGGVDVATDIVYVARRLLGLTPVPAAFRDARAGIPDDATIAARVDDARNLLDVDMNGVVDAATDITYIARRLLRLPPVPESQRALDPAIPTDTTIGTNVDRLCP